jgi:iron complex outermembrane receptor protein
MKWLKVLILVLIPVLGLSQRPANIKAPGAIVKGKVVDGMNGAPIEFSSVSIYKRSDSSLVSVTTSSADGSFALENIPQGLYRVKSSFVGYKTLRTDSVLVTGMKPVDIGTLSLLMAEQIIGEVVVKGEKSLYENKIDRKVFNVDKSIVAQSGTATDVLQQVPSVSVDQDGVVSLRGSENVNILVNGRPTLIDKTVLLQQIAANTIEKIEVITNPSVKYDSEGTSGIINIVLKQGVAQGLNGTVAINAGGNDSYDAIPRYNGSVNINYNPGKYNVFASYSYRREEGTFEGESHRYFKNDATRLNSNNFGVRMRESNSIRLGIDYFVDKSLTVGVNGSYSIGRDEDRDDDKYNFLNAQGNSVYKSFRNSNGTEENYSKEFAAYITKKFEKDGHELKIDYSYGDGVDDELNSAQYDSTFTDVNYAFYKKTEVDTSYDYRSNQIISVDYSFPINDIMKLELGGKLNLRDNQDTSYTAFAFYQGIPNNLSYSQDSRKSYNYKYHEDITSLYGTYSLTLGDFSAMLGLKAEFANYNFDILHSNSAINNTFFSFIPSLHMVEKLNDKNEMNLSYSRRIQRPRGWDLSPIPNYSDLSIVRKGNPDLKPEYTNSIELGYTYKPEKFTLQPTVFYRLIEDRFNRSRITTPGVKVDTLVVENLPYSSTYGMDMAVTYQPFKFWNLNISGSLFQYTIEATTTTAEKQNLGYNGKIMSNTMLPQAFAIQIAAFYRSPFLTTQGESDPFYSVNIGLKKDLLKGKLTATLNFNDIFNTMHFGMSSSTANDNADMWRKRESSYVMAGLTYKFGKAPKNGKKTNNGQDRSNEGQMDEGF